jgi:hypothetical protein
VRRLWLRVQGSQAASQVLQRDLPEAGESGDGVTQVVPFPTRRATEAVVLIKRQLADYWGVSTRWVELRFRDDGLPSVGIFAG